MKVLKSKLVDKILQDHRNRKMWYSAMSEVSLENKEVEFYIDGELKKFNLKVLSRI